MDFDISVAEQLGADAEQCFASLARRTELYKIELHLLEQRERDAEAEEKELQRRMKVEEDLEVAYNQEAASLREQLAAKSGKLQELSRVLAEDLTVIALQRETASLQDYIAQQQAKAERLTRELGSRSQLDAMVSSHLAAFDAIRRKCKAVTAETEKKCDEALQQRFSEDDKSVGLIEEAEEREYCKHLEEAIEEMALHLARERLDAADQQAYAGSSVAVTVAEDIAESLGEAAENREEVSLEAALGRLSLLRDEGESQFSLLESALKQRVERNRQLALLEIPDFTANVDEGDDGAAASANPSPSSVVPS